MLNGTTGNKNFPRTKCSAELLSRVTWRVITTFSDFLLRQNVASFWTTIKNLQQRDNFSVQRLMRGKLLLRVVPFNITFIKPSFSRRALNRVEERKARMEEGGYFKEVASSPKSKNWKDNWRLKWKNRYPIYDQNGWKTIGTLLARNT